MGTSTMLNPPWPLVCATTYIGRRKVCVGRSPQHKPLLAASFTLVRYRSWPLVQSTERPLNTHPDEHGEPSQNQLLAALPDADWQRWQPQLEWVPLNVGQLLCEYGKTPAYAFFPTTAIVSLTYTTEDGASAEFAVVGNDGVVGISLFMGGGATSSQAVVQSAGMAWSLPAHAVSAEVDRAGAVLTMLLRYTQAMMVQVAQTGACNRHHSIDQQLCRRLLMGLDRLGGDELVMSQEAAAQLLGVRREGVTAAALKLQHAGVIRYHRGHIEVLDRSLLEERSCECYGAARREQQRLMPLPLPLPLRLWS